MKAQISDTINGSIIQNEMDVMILTHHGAYNSFTNVDFLNRSRPTIAICSSNYDNVYDHPKPEIRNMLYKAGIPIFTTKTGDVLVYLQVGSQRAYILNLKSNNYDISSNTYFVP
jgi:competence protein ComEC